MTVRRLDEIQPESFAFTEANLEWARKTIAKYPPGRQASAVIPILWRIQEQEGWVSEPAIRLVAEMLDMPKIRVLEIATFYTMFHLSPVGKKAHVQVCGTTPCMLRGAEDLKHVCQKRIHHDPHHLSADGDFSWEEVECLGACVNAPMVQIWSDTYEDLTPESLEKLLDDFAAGRPVKPGPQIDRFYSEPAGGPITLIDESLYDGSMIGKGAGLAAAKAAIEAQAVAAAEAATVEAAAPAGEPAKPPAAPAVKAAAEADKEKVPDTYKPELLRSARDDKPDDLKLIWGVGPQLEKTLHSLGVFHFDQVAGWTIENLKWVDEHLEGFRGRAVRDKWIEQAQKLVTGWRPTDVTGEKPE